MTSALDRVNSNTLHAVLRRSRPAALDREPPRETEADATARLISDVRSALALESGSTQAKQLELEQRIAAIEKRMGMDGGTDARAQIGLLQHQLSLAHAAIQAMVKSEQNKNLEAVHLTSRDIKRRLRRHIIRKSLLLLLTTAATGDVSQPAGMRRRMAAYVASLRLKLNRDLAVIVNSATSHAVSTGPAVASKRDATSMRLMRSAKNGWIAIKAALRQLRVAKSKVPRPALPPPSPKGVPLTPMENERAARMVEEGMPMQDAVAFVKKYPDASGKSSSSSSSGIVQRGVGSSSKIHSSASNLEARLSQRLASLEMDEAKRISRLIRYVVGHNAPTALPSPSTPSKSTSSSAVLISQRLPAAAAAANAAAAKEVAGEQAAALIEVEGERAAAKAARDAARSSVATYLAHLEGVSDLMKASSFTFAPVDEDDNSPPSASSTTSPASHPRPSAAAGPKILGPAWTRSRIEPPAGSKDMGGWKAAVCVNS